MSMTTAEAIDLVEVLLRAYPTYPLDKDGVRIYAEALVKQCPFDASVAFAAVHGYIVNEPWMPKVNELLDVIEVEAASRNLVSARALRSGEPPTTREERSVQFDVLRTVLEELPPRPGLSPDEVAAYSERFVERCKELARAHGIDPDEDGRLFVCPRCQDTGYEVETNDAGVSVAIPCPCNPARYDRWRGGHFEPGHTCAECTAIVKGKR